MVETLTTVVAVVALVASATGQPTYPDTYSFTVIGNASKDVTRACICFIRGPFPSVPVRRRLIFRGAVVLRLASVPSIRTSNAERARDIPWGGGLL